MLPSRWVALASVLRKRLGLGLGALPPTCASPSTALVSAPEFPGAGVLTAADGADPLVGSCGLKGQRRASLAGGMGRGVRRGRLWWISLVDCCVF